MSHDQKISSFTSQPLFQDTDLITFVRNGTNFNGAFSTLKLSLGVTGTLNPVGDVLGVPVLEQPVAGTNNIRAIESGAGIIASVSAESGILLKTDFIQGASGTQLIKNLADKQQLFRSLVAGTGINIASTGDSIQITSVTAVASSKTVVISVESDFPAAVAGVITLAADTQYLIVQDISTANRFIMNDKTTIQGTDSVNITFTYSGTGDMFTGVNTVNRISKLAINCPNGRFLTWLTNVFKILRMVDITIVACDKVALMNSIGGVGVCRFTNVSPASIATDGVEITGDWNSFLYEVSAANLTAGSYFNLGTATFDSFIIDVILINLAAGANLISGATGSANINTGGIGLVTRVLSSGAGSVLSGVTSDDALWNFQNNDDIPDTRPDGLLSMQGNATNTVIASSGVGVLVAGTWAIETFSQFTGTTAGRLTYDGGKDAKLPITASVTVEPVSGGTQDMGVQVAINGTMIANSKRVSATSSGNPITIDMHWQEVLSTIDFVEVFVSNESGTTNVLVSSAILRVN